MTTLVDITGYRQLPGSQPSAQFTGYAVLQSDGVEPREMASDWISQMCDYTLHIDNYESALSTGRSSTLRDGVYSDETSLREDFRRQPPEVDPEDLRKHGDGAVRMVYDLAVGESARWADLVNTAASMAEIEETDQ